MQSYGEQMRAAMQTLRATDVQFQVFTQGLSAVLQQWTALQLVALHCDARAPAVLFDDLCAWHQRDGEVFVDDLEVYFEDFFDNVREVKIEDDSMKEVATVLHDMYCRCCANDASLVEHYQQTLAVYTQTNPVGLSVNGGTAEDLAEDGDDGEEGEEAEGDCGNEEEGQGAAVPHPMAMPQQQQAPAPQPTQQQQQQQKAPKQQKKRKNASVRDKNGWNIVQ